MGSINDATNGGSYGYNDNRTSFTLNAASYLYSTDPDSDGVTFDYNLRFPGQ